MSLERLEKVSSFEEARDHVISYVEDDAYSEAEDTVASFAEDEPETLGEFKEDFEEEIKLVQEEFSEFVEEVGEDKSISDIIPGSELRLSETEEDEEVERETDYENDGDLSKFLDYVSRVYPSEIPKHDGTTMLGCEKAISFLDRLNSQISRSIREDVDDVLDVSSLEQVRVSIMKDTMVLKDHLNKLKKKFKDHHKKDASTLISDSSGIPHWKNSKGEHVSFSELSKEAATPAKMYISVPPFERAIAGILINAHVSGGNSMEDVWEILSKKYDINDREELSIMQVVMDMGFHLFKDRGTFSGGESDEKDKTHGVEFIKNYFN
tara:strand:+ start:1190 stop:2158 length:969 start_codon:yes stop_codon:yes gene_type:complete